MSQHSTLPAYAVEIDQLAKIYGGRNGSPRKVALDQVSLNIPRGSFFGLLGPNGAGKSTLINILAGLVRKTSGTARVWGADTSTEERRARSAIGVVPQEINFDPFFTPFELLEVQAGLYGVPKAERRTDQILAALGLTDKAHAYARTLSGGMRRRLLIGKALVHNPPVLVLDEPTAGVDIELRQQLWAYVKELNERGTTVLLTTHYLEEAEALCDRIAIIDQGKLVAHDETKTLLRGLDSKVLTVSLEGELSQIPAGLLALGAESKDLHTLAFRYKPSQAHVALILAALQDAGLAVRDLSTSEADLEDLFLTLTGSGAAENALS